MDGINLKSVCGWWVGRYGDIAFIIRYLQSQNWQVLCRWMVIGGLII